MHDTSVKQKLERRGRNNYRGWRIRK